MYVMEMKQPLRTRRNMNQSRARSENFLRPKLLPMIHTAGGMEMISSRPQRRRFGCNHIHPGSGSQELRILDYMKV